LGGAAPLADPVGLAEPAHQVHAGEQADQGAVAAHHGQAADAPGQHDLGGLGEADVLLDGDRVGAHDLAHGGAPLAQDVGLGDHADAVASVGDHRHAGDAHAHDDVDGGVDGIPDVDRLDIPCHDI